MTSKKTPPKPKVKPKTPRKPKPKPRPMRDTNYKNFPGFPTTKPMIKRGIWGILADPDSTVSMNNSILLGKLTNWFVSKIDPKTRQAVEINKRNIARAVREIKNKPKSEPKKTGGKVKGRKI